MNGKDVNTNRQLDLVKTQDGSDTIYSQQFNEHYHSLAGSIGESLHVYIKNGLNYYLKQNPNKRQVVVFEVGFGTGLNAFLTLLDILDCKDLQIKYYAIEKYPIDLQLLDQFNLASRNNKKSLFMQINFAPWNEPVEICPCFTLFKINEDWTNFDLKQYDIQPDVVYYDAFSYQAQPEMWAVDRFKHLWQNMTPCAVLTTYASKGVIKQALREAGFAVERLDGAHNKKNMLRAVKPAKGKKPIKYIHISNIKFDSIPLNPQTLDLAIKLQQKKISPESLPPIKVMLLDNGQYLIRDGRHRVAAFKLNGLRKIKAYVYRPVKK